MKTNEPQDQVNQVDEKIEDPLFGLHDVPEAQEEEKKKGLFGWRKKKPKRVNKDTIVRIDELRERLARGEGLAENEVLSTYMPQRRARLFGKALLRLDRVRIFILFSALVVAFLFMLAMMQEKMGNFTINLDRLEMFRKGIAMSADANFTKPTARLTAEVVKDATNISINDLPKDIDDIDGGHNGQNYMAYTYYVRNAGKEDVSYTAALTLDKCSKGAEQAVRVAVWRNGKRTVYAMPSAIDGEPEPGCKNFYADNIAMVYTEPNFEVGNVDKYTVVIWMEGDDPECVDSIIGGAVEFTMKIAATNEDETTLLQKFVRDIIDTIRGDKPISAAGNESPDFYKWQDVNWENRKNQDNMIHDEEEDSDSHGIETGNGDSK